MQSDWCRLHNNIVSPANLGLKADYYLFKVSQRFSAFLTPDNMTDASLGSQEDIIPAWEDVANKNGGKWSVQLPKEKTKTIIDQMWLYTVGHLLLS
jgi:translation initiation factor 4E